MRKLPWAVMPLTIEVWGAVWVKNQRKVDLIFYGSIYYGSIA